MNKLLSVSFVLSLIVAFGSAQETCGVFFPRRCGETECCLFRILGICKRLPQLNESCGLLSCPCSPGLECVRRGRGKYVCASSTAGTTTPVTLGRNETTPTLMPITPPTTTTTVSPPTSGSSSTDAPTQPVTDAEISVTTPSVSLFTGV